MTGSTNQPPVRTLRDGALKISIWRNEGDRGPYLVATPSRTYEKDGGLHDSNSYSRSDMLRLSELARQAYGAMHLPREDSTGEEEEPEPRTKTSKAASAPAPGR